MEATSELVLKKVRQLFPPSQAETVIAALDLHDFDFYGNERVQLAILKLSDGRLDRLRFCLTNAKHDPRDVLAPAEYPRQMQMMYSGKYDTKTAAQKQEMQEKDRQQYLDWLHDDSQNP